VGFLLRIITNILNTQRNKPMTYKQQ